MKKLLLNALPSPLVRRIKERLRPRRIHVYCVGAGKTGTHSMAAIFDENFRAAHEPERAAMRELAKRDEAGTLTPEGKRRYLLERDTRLFLEVEAAAFNRRNITELVDLFPQARFIVTVRDPYTYTDSVINHLLNHSVALEGERRAQVAGVMGAERFSHSPEEHELRDLGLHTLDGYLSNYAASTADILMKTPPERCLVVRTDRIGESIDTIAAFLGISADLLQAKKSHAFKASKKHGVLSRIDPQFVDAKVREHCATISDDYFPEIRSMSDVFSRLEPSP